MLERITVLDGGMGSELLNRTGHRGGLWSAQALLDAPELVLAVHTDYIDAGADVIIANNYSTIPSYLGKAGLADQYQHMTHTAGELARRAAKLADRDVQVLGSMPPLQESYRHDLVQPEAQARPIYHALVEALAPHVDGFVCETMSSATEARVAASSVRDAGFDGPLWVAWTLTESADGTLRSGDTIAQAYAALAGLNVDAYLFNCCTPDAITAALPQLAALTDRPYGAYPNLMHIPPGWTLDNDVASERFAMSVEEFVACGETWRAAGASIIGGCCGIGPSHIAGLAQALKYPVLVEENI